MEDQFSVFWTDPDGTMHTEFKFKGIDDVQRAVTRLTRGPAAMMGAVVEVLVVDSDDCTNFLWKKGKVLFPTEADINGM